MALKNTMEQMRKQLRELTGDLEKAERGNKAAAQRVRTNSIKFAKTAKTFRKESVAAEKKGTFKKAAKKTAKPSKKSASRGKSAKKVSRKKTTARKRGKVKARRR
ncbi:MAG: hypothetical protein Tsb0015_14800 [Simkaniaceae bacterium]